MRTASNITARTHDHGKGTIRLRVAAIASPVHGRDGDGLSDSELLERYRAKRAESAEAATAAEMAFAALVDRHGAMVWGVCRARSAMPTRPKTPFRPPSSFSSVRPDRCGWMGPSAAGFMGSPTALCFGRGPRPTAEGPDRPSPPTSSDDPAGDVELKDLRNAVGEELDRLRRSTDARSSCATSRG